MAADDSSDADSGADDSGSEYQEEEDEQAGSEAAEEDGEEEVVDEQDEAAARRDALELQGQNGAKTAGYQQPPPMLPLPDTQPPMQLYAPTAPAASGPMFPVPVSVQDAALDAKAVLPVQNGSAAPADESPAKRSAIQRIHSAIADSVLAINGELLTAANAEHDGNKVELSSLLERISLNLSYLMQMSDRGSKRESAEMSIQLDVRGPDKMSDKLEKLYEQLRKQKHEAEELRKAAILSSEAAKRAASPLSRSQIAEAPAQKRVKVEAESAPRQSIPSSMPPFDAPVRPQSRQQVFPPVTLPPAAMPTNMPMQPTAGPSGYPVSMSPRMANVLAPTGGRASPVSSAPQAPMTRPASQASHLQYAPSPAANRVMMGDGRPQSRNSMLNGQGQMGPPPQPQMASMQSPMSMPMPGQQQQMTGAPLRPSSLTPDQIAMVKQVQTYNQEMQKMQDFMRAPTFSQVVPQQQAMLRNKFIETQQQQQAVLRQLQAQGLLNRGGPGPHQGGSLPPMQQQRPMQNSPAPGQMSYPQASIAQQQGGLGLGQPPQQMGMQQQPQMQMGQYGMPPMQMGGMYSQAPAAPPQGHFAVPSLPGYGNAGSPPPFGAGSPGPSAAGSPAAGYGTPRRTASGAQMGMYGAPSPVASGMYSTPPPQQTYSHLRQSSLPGGMGQSTYNDPMMYSQPPPMPGGMGEAPSSASNEPDWSSLLNDGAMS